MIMITTYTKEDVIESLRKIKAKGWVQNRRHGNAGGVGNTLEDLLGVKENNLAIANAGEWELKTQRKQTNSLLTLFHCEPSPRNARLVPQMLLPLYGWRHKEAGNKYPDSELSFRQTIDAISPSDRGFMVKIDYANKRFQTSFDSRAVSERHEIWLESVKSRAGLGELDPQPYWGFSDIEHKAGTKLLNCFYILAETKRENGQEYYLYDDIKMLNTFSFDKLLEAIKQGDVLVDFDARTGHNHGTKFRVKQSAIANLYDSVTTIS